jgi:hypothetical protein
MRSILIAMLVAAGVGLAGTSGVAAAPISGAGIKDAATFSDLIEQAQWHSRRRSHWRWGSRRTRMCHRWRSSRWRPCRW